MSYFPRADDFASALGYDHTPAGPDDFIFNYDTTPTVSHTEDTLLDTLSLHNDFEDYRRRNVTTSRTNLKFLLPHRAMRMIQMLSLKKDLILFTVKNMGIFNLPPVNLQKSRKDKKHALMLWLDIPFTTLKNQGEYRKDLCNLVMEVTDAHHNYELKLLKLSIEVTPKVPPVSGHLLKPLAQKKREDNKILENLRSWVTRYEDAFIIRYYRDEIGLAYQLCTIMDDRPLKRHANDNGNLDTHYGHHKDKK
ncbi:2029_t:CDS:2, partial [Rhizophagus irregularis]